MKLRKPLFFVCAMLCTQIVWTQSIEKLDSLIIFNEVENRINSRTTYDYDDLFRDTFSNFYFFNESTQELEFFSRTRNFYFPNQRVIERFSATINGLELRETISFDDNGDQIEKVVEKFSFQTQIFDTTSRFVTTLRTDSLWTEDVYSWINNEFVLTSKQIKRYLPFGGSIDSVYILENSVFIPVEVRTLLYDETTGIEVLKKFEVYNSNTLSWFIPSESNTTIDYDNFSAYKVFSFTSTDGSVSIVDSLVYSYTPDWLVDEEFTYIKNSTSDEYELRSKFEYTYTDARNIDELAILINDEDSLGLQTTYHYYYTTFQISAVEELSSKSFPLNLAFKNPASSNQVEIRIEGDLSNNEAFLFRLSDLSGRSILQQWVRQEDLINLNNQQLHPGIYFLSLSNKAGETKTWKMIVN